MKKNIKKNMKYYLIIIIFLCMGLIAFYLYSDAKNDVTYLISQGFEDMEIVLDKAIVLKDSEYCEANNPYGLCNISYMKGIRANLAMNIVVNKDNTGFGFSIEHKGIFKKKSYMFYITPDMTSITGNDKVCIVDANLNVLESKKNANFCYTDEYNKYIENHKEIIDATLKEFYSYYDNFNMARYMEI